MFPICSSVNQALSVVYCAQRRETLMHILEINFSLQERLRNPAAGARVALHSWLWFHTELVFGVDAVS